MWPFKTLCGGILDLNIFKWNAPPPPLQKLLETLLVVYNIEHEEFNKSHGSI